MTEISFNNPVQDLTYYNQLDLLFKIYRLRKIRKKLTSKLKSFEISLKSGKVPNVGYKFEALKALITENGTQLKNLLLNLEGGWNLFNLTRNLKDCELYIQNLIKGRKKKHIDLETFELTKGHYLQKILDIENSRRQLKLNASIYFQELRNKLIVLEDKRIRLTTEKMRGSITKEEFKKKQQEIENLKQGIEEKIAFLKVEIIDLDLGGDKV